MSSSPLRLATALNVNIIPDTFNVRLSASDESQVPTKNGGACSTPVLYEGVYPGLMRSGVDASPAMIQPSHLKCKS